MMSFIQGGLYARIISARCHQTMLRGIREGPVTPTPGPKQAGGLIQKMSSLSPDNTKILGNFGEPCKMLILKGLL